MAFNQAFIPQGPSYARSITAAQVNALSPVGFTAGGSCYRIFNSGTVPVAFLPFLAASGTPVLTFPVDGAPPTGQLGTVIAPGAVEVIQGPANADSFAAIGQGAGPSIIFVSRGDGV